VVESDGSGIFFFFERLMGRGFEVGVAATGAVGGEGARGGGETDRSGRSI